MGRALGCGPTPWVRDPVPVAGLTAPQANLSWVQPLPAHCLFLQDNLLLIGVTLHLLHSLLGRKKDQKPPNQLGVFSLSLTSLLPYFYAWGIPLCSGWVYIPEERIRLLCTWLYASLTSHGRKWFGYGIEDEFTFSYLHRSTVIHSFVTVQQQHLTEVVPQSAKSLITSFNVPLIFCLHRWDEAVQERSSTELVLVFKAMDAANGWLGAGQVTTAASCFCLLFSLSAVLLFVDRRCCPRNICPPKCSSHPPACDSVTKGICIFHGCEGMKYLCPQEEAEVKYRLSEASYLLSVTKSTA